MENEDLTIVIPSDKGDIEHTVLAAFEIDNNNYIAVVPNSAKSPEILLYKYEETSDDEISLLAIESDEEFRLASETFDSLLDDSDFNI